jgi:hypothetical protein
VLLPRAAPGPTLASTRFSSSLSLTSSVAAGPSTEGAGGRSWRQGSSMAMAARAPPVEHGRQGQSPLVEAAMLIHFIDDALQCDPAEEAVVWILGPFQILRP